MSEVPSAPASSNFIRQLIDADLAAGRVQGVVTRFPPEPNGYLHIGHAKSICLNFGLARDYAGRCHLRFDDTNPVKEDTEYVDAIMEDVRWLGFDWGVHLYYASDYFERLYAWAEHLTLAGKAYVCDLSAEEVRNTRGTLTEPGVESPGRSRSIEENLDLFRRMRRGEFPDGARTLRARGDMAASNLNLRDPVMYRILHATHHRTGDAWCIYPMYDWAHGQSDAIEGITHSICTLEFEDHRPLYDWYLENVPDIPAAARPHQIEFARLNLNYTVMSKRMLMTLVREGHVSGWDDPRMPTLAGLRRRGVPPEALRDFAERIGVAKADSIVDMGLLESCIRDDLNVRARRAMCVHRPLRVILTNWPEGRVEEFEMPWGADGTDTRRVPLGRELFIEREDFELDPPKGFFRLAPGREVRLRNALVVRCDEVVQDETGVVALRCTADLDSLGGTPADGRKVKGTIHWVDAARAVPATLRLYDRLFTVPNPAAVREGERFTDTLNPDSLTVLEGAMLEPALAGTVPGQRLQFERKGYYCCDLDSRPDALVFNRVVTLRDAWTRAQAG
jgi:glutaminyl-tRNA synthetase